MTTIFCPHCESEISATARKCPHCGEWVRGGTSAVRIFGAIVAAVAFFSMIRSCGAIGG